MSIAAPQQNRAPRVHPPAAERSETPTIKGADGALKYIHQDLGTPGITMRTLKSAAEKRNVEVFLLSGAYWFSEQGLYDWVMSLRQGGVQR